MRLGILGAGQLGRMLGQAALPLGIECVFLDPAEDPCAAAVGRVVRADYDDEAALDALAAVCDVVTWEFENVPVFAAERLAARVPVYPPPAALRVAQDRLVEKTFLRDAGVEVAPFRSVDNQDELEAAVEALGLPAVLKTRRMGYDGKGQRWLAGPDDVAGAFHALGGVPCILEGAVAFDRELSVLAVRSLAGEIRTWPLPQNHHRGGILRWSRAPAPDLEPATQQRADDIAARVTGALDYVGVIAIELFQVGDALLANEIAPRVHNSGHWSIEGARTSQFENHVRAVLGLPLGDTAVPAPCAMVNLIGTTPPLVELLGVQGARVHLYGKDPRPGRKLGHVTALAPGALEALLALAGG